MKKNALIRTNMIVCGIITAGFIVTSVIGYRSNTAIFKQDAEHVSMLAADGIYDQIDKLLSEPVNVSLTMANDSLLKSFLADEEEHLEDGAYIRQIQEYLYAYREKYSYDSVFLVSTQTKRYYHFEGLDRILTPENPENDWYYDFLKTGGEYSLNVDNDEAADNSVTAFVNCKIQDKNGAVMGIIGVGMKVKSLQAMLKSYDEEFYVTAHLIDDEGFVQLSSEQNGHEPVNLFEDAAMNRYKDEILKKQDGQRTLWYSAANAKRYIVSRYVPSMKWHLVVENDMTFHSAQLHIQLFKRTGIILLIIGFVLFTITHVLRQYKEQIERLSVSQGQDYQRLLSQATAGLYEDILEIDITHNRAGSENAERYFSERGMNLDTPYDKAVHTFAGCRINEEYRQGYLDMFLPDRVIESFKNGITNLNYDFLSLASCENYIWMRITCRIFYWESDESLRMISYHMNIDEEKKRELSLLRKSQKDSLTCLYNKGAAEGMMCRILDAEGDMQRRHTLLMIDIDNFKGINDKYGHAFGDSIIIEFAEELKNHFWDTDIVGRIGGDEFAVLIIDFGELNTLRKKLDRFCSRIARKDFGQPEGTSITCSMGAAIYPEHGASFSELFEKADQALYYAKAHGKSSFHIAGGSTCDSKVSYVDSRDFKAILENTTDGVAKFALTEPLKLLYFNQKLIALAGAAAQGLSSAGLNPLSWIHPDDVNYITEVLKEAVPERKPITAACRLRQSDGQYLPIRVRGFFINELYKNQYPIFYTVFLTSEKLQ